MSSDLARTVLGFKIEATPGVAETLVTADFQLGMYDVEIVKNAPDVAPIGKAGNGTLINTAHQYTRSRGGTAALKMEVTNAAPATRPPELDILEVAGFQTGVIDPGVNDNYYFEYAGTPNCTTGTFQTQTERCDGASTAKTLRGSVVSGGVITVESAGSPMVFTGTASGAFVSPEDKASIEPGLSTGGECLIGTGTLFTVFGKVYNLTKWAFNTNTAAGVYPDSSQEDKSNIANYKLGGVGSGDPTMTISAVAVAESVANEWLSLQSEETGVMTMVGDGYTTTISKVQFTDIQEEDAAGVMLNNIEVKVQGTYRTEYTNI